MQPHILVTQALRPELIYVAPTALGVCMQSYSHETL